MPDATTLRPLEDDTEYEEVTIAKVLAEPNGWGNTRADGWSFYVPAEHGVTPRVGQVARFYGKGIGFDVRGLALDGVTVFYRTPEEERARREQWLRDVADRKRRRFEEQGEDLDARVAALPGAFRERIEGFRAWRPEWRAEYEGYELFTCEQAMVFAAALPTREQLAAFAAEPWERAKETVPGLSGQHSGNTFGAAVNLAIAYIERPESVPEVHGALCALVGCREYGCWTARREAAVS